MIITTHSYNMNENVKKFAHAGVNTDRLSINSLYEENKNHTSRLKERQVKHIRIEDPKELEQIYVLGEEIGRGGFAKVVSVLEKSTSKIWAMKTVVKAKAGSRAKLIQTEIKILKLIQHPHIIYLDKIFETSKKYFMILEKCCGQLAKLYKERKPFSETICRKIMQELVSAITYLHKYDIVHRDLKMENILIAENPGDPNDEYYVKIADFGLSVVKSGPGLSNMLHDYCGTTLYMSPEMLIQCSYSQQCDIWALGVILYMLLLGAFPFYSSNPEELLRQISRDDPNFSNANLSREVIHLIRQLLTKNPANRITASEVLEHPWMQHQPLYIGTSGNILEMMKEWKKTNMVSEPEITNRTGTSSEPRTSKGKEKLVKVINPKIPIELPKTNIKFDRTNYKHRRSPTAEDRNDYYLSNKASSARSSRRSPTQGSNH